MSLIWNGDNVVDKVLQAVQLGMDKTMGECVEAAFPKYYLGHGYRWGPLQGSVRFQPSFRSGNDIVGFWGSHNISYAIFVEKGTSRMPGQRQLQSSADEVYPRLTENIKEQL